MLNANLFCFCFLRWFVWLENFRKWFFVFLFYINELTVLRLQMCDFWRKDSISYPYVKHGIKCLLGKYNSMCIAHEWTFGEIKFSFMRFGFCFFLQRTKHEIVTIEVIVQSDFNFSLVCNVCIKFASCFFYSSMLECGVPLRSHK